ncbi:hypothetical protein TNIN_11591 [Trichonephila inaurata madagascariensis]|uniref:Uncharacterized protein n=1 Tax=Trichonephila inaurata madagascariensis TaxID=2747483 RepID=A0A8X7CQC2_9ARAC|nr:hypothetical protein TNIN_11591 [Trichonephila inaurata madagascariensis]
MFHFCSKFEEARVLLLAPGIFILVQRVRLTQVTGFLIVSVLGEQKHFFRVGAFVSRSVLFGLFGAAPERERPRKGTAIISQRGPTESGRGE